MKQCSSSFNHDQESYSGDYEGKDLRNREADGKSIRTGTKKLYQETLHAGEETIETEKPAIIVRVAAKTPE